MNAVPPDLVTVKYSCHSCRDERVRVRVRRRRKSEEIKVWLDVAVMPECQALHWLRSPLCNGRHLDLHLPIADGGVGTGEAKQLTPEEKAEWRRAIEESK